MALKKSPGAMLPVTAPLSSGCVLINFELGSPGQSVIFFFFRDQMSESNRNGQSNGTDKSDHQKTIRLTFPQNTLRVCRTIGSSQNLFLCVCVFLNYLFV